MSDLVERCPKEAAMLREIAQSYSRGVDWQAYLSASAAVIDLAAARITELETALAEAKTWRDAVDNALVTDWLGTADSFPDAATAVARLIEWNMTVAVDPAVSKPAADLVAEAEGRVIAEVVAWLRDENGQCDCFARSEGECACGAWDDYKTRPLLDIATALETGEWKK